MEILALIQIFWNFWQRSTEISFEFTEIRQDWLKLASTLLELMQSLPYYKFFEKWQTLLLIEIELNFGINWNLFKMI